MFLSFLSYAMGPWSTRAGDWLGIDVPMTGIKSVSLVYEASQAVAEEPAALFCAEDDNGCHLEVYPRSTGVRLGWGYYQSTHRVNWSLIYITAYFFWFLIWVN